MRTYYIKDGEFSNQYSLRYAENKEQAQILLDKGYSKTTRANAISWARREKYLRDHDLSFSGFADDCIKPYDWDDRDGDPFYKVKNYIMEWVCGWMH